jgi:hypothetical protein
MLARILQRRRDRRRLDYSALTSSDPVFGRLDGEDAPGFDLEAALDHAATLQAEEIEGEEPIDNALLIQMLEAQLDVTINALADANAIVEAAQEFCRAITAINEATGEAVYKTTRDDALATQLLNHRYSDLAALLNDSGRPVPGKLAQGTIH